ncbi:hypothetical protein NCAS_0A10470 [Naumovozyma castellii]|uniref:DNA-binding protein REB1 n=1 Tax=Naumovozyma castellii TaxID=27288 RepID=G0V807_NAUCA|nr:hypothetical protein NCAS_0A10470 [Naumovozyma castellii CBS 4309]CCC67605.1 hypothetical protein NCAS_0A10470 [Naumovozyma castellii CBS 4309]
MSKHSRHSDESVEEAVFKYIGSDDVDKNKKKKKKSKTKKHSEGGESMNWFMEHNEIDGSQQFQESESREPDSVAMAAVAAAYANSDIKTEKRSHDESVAEGSREEQHIKKKHKSKDKRSKKKKSKDKSKKEKLQLAVDPELATLDNSHIHDDGNMDSDSHIQNTDFQQYLNTDGELVKHTEKSEAEEDEEEEDDEEEESSDNESNKEEDEGIESPAVTQVEQNKQYSELQRTDNDASAITDQSSAENKLDSRAMEARNNELIASAATKASKSVPSNITGGKVFDENEEAALDQFIEQYRQIKNFTLQQTKERIWATGRKRDDFWVNICKILPYRSRSSIYKHVRRRYHIFEQRGKWTPEEDEALAKLCIQKEGQWADVGRALGRMPEDCRDRWRNYIKCGSNRTANRWSAEEEIQLKKVIAEMLEEAQEFQVKRERGEIDSDTADIPLKGRGAQGRKLPNKPSFRDIINWTVVSERMGGTRSRIQCRYKWTKLVRKQAQTNIQNMSVEDKRWILEKLRDLGFTEDSQVDWDELATIKPDSKWNGLELKLCYEKMRSLIKQHKEKKVNEIATELIKILDNSLF